MYQRIKELRLDKNLTKTQIANYLQISLYQYTLYENCKKTVPLSILTKLAIFYNTSIDYIVGDTDIKTRHK